MAPALEGLGRRVTCLGIAAVTGVVGFAASAVLPAVGTIMGWSMGFVSLRRPVVRVAAARKAVDGRPITGNPFR